MSYSKSRVKKSTRARCKRHNGGGLISFLGVNSSREPIPHVIISLLSVDPIVVVSLSHRPTKDDYHYPIYRLLFIEHSILLDRFRRFSSYLSCATCSTFRPLMDMCGGFMPDVQYTQSWCVLLMFPSIITVRFLAKRESFSMYVMIFSKIHLINLLVRVNQMT